MMKTSFYSETDDYNDYEQKFVMEAEQDSPLHKIEEEDRITIKF